MKKPENGIEKYRFRAILYCIFLLYCNGVVPNFRLKSAIKREQSENPDCAQVSVTVAPSESNLTARERRSDIRYSRGEVCIYWRNRRFKVAGLMKCAAKISCTLLISVKRFCISSGIFGRTGGSSVDLGVYSLFFNSKRS